MARQQSESFLQATWEEVSPLARHGVAVLLLLSLVWLVALVINNMKPYVPEHHHAFELVAMIEGWVIVTLFSMFSAYTIVEIGKRLFTSIRR